MLKLYKENIQTLMMDFKKIQDNTKLSYFLARNIKMEIFPKFFSV